LYAGTTGTHAAISVGGKRWEAPKHHAHKKKMSTWGKNLKTPK
jgi:hypothetical protein